MQRAKRQRDLECGFTLFGWDGNNLAWESSPPRDDGDSGRTVHYLYEPGSFVPVAQALRKSPIRLHKQPDWSQREYDFDQDPLWHTEVKPQGFDAIAWYQCDHLGTPMELTDEQGNVAWAGQYKAWGEVREERSEWARQQGLSNPIRFPGQYQDCETGLHYNRHRYYEPRQGRFISRDPISYRGGLNLYAYTPNPVGWTDASGLCSTRLNRNLGGIKYDNLQAHHIIPEEIWEDNITFMDDIGVGGNMDNKENGVLMPDSADKAKQMKRKFYHCGSHDVYSRAVQEEISEIASAFYSGAISDGEARQEISAIQVRNRMWLKTPAIPGTSPIRLR
ncbi:hypothetical protein PVLB_25480 [Pseudomonas sp. VLB120]|nr:hypothetical protein PVLB_25480 [Pseudomonas sp. VLB120]